MADLVLTSLRGGLNEDEPSSIGDTQCAVAHNVELWRAKLGARRSGSVHVDVTGSVFATALLVTWVHRHEPTTNPSEAQLWAFGVQGGSTPVLAYKDTSWHTVSMTDTPVINTVAEYQIQAVSLHGKLFIAYKSTNGGSPVDRLHVWDGTSLRRVGMAAPGAAPTAADGGGAGTLSGTRYYRVRFIAKSGSTVLRRSEPSATLTHTPGGANLNVTITKPATVSEGETHWELEASMDNANFYVLATTVVGTTTATDTVAYGTGYPGSGFDTLSDDIGDYETFGSVRFLTTDQDRLICGGSFESTSLASRVMWSPVNADPGDGNDERIPRDTSNYIDLDNRNGGGLTNLSATANGYIYATKMSQVYQLARTGNRTRAYEDRPLTKERGALFNSLVTTLDQAGNPVPMFLDPHIGPCRIGTRGVEHCGADLQVTWADVNLDAAGVVCSSLYFPARQQVIWNIATGSSAFPDASIVLHTPFMRATDDGYRGGWVTWDGVRSQAIAMCLFSHNVDDNTARSNVLEPFMGMIMTNKPIHRLTGDWSGSAIDEGQSGNSEFTARIVTKAFARRNLLATFDTQKGILIADEYSGGVVKVSVIGELGLSGYSYTSTNSISLTPAGSELFVIRPIDDLKLSEMHVVQIEFTDTATLAERHWSLHKFVLEDATGGK